MVVGRDAWGVVRSEGIARAKAKWQEEQSLGQWLSPATYSNHLENVKEAMLGPELPPHSRPEADHLQPL